MTNYRCEIKLRTSVDGTLDGVQAVADEARRLLSGSVLFDDALKIEIRKVD